MLLTNADSDPRGLCARHCNALASCRSGAENYFDYLESFLVHKCHDDSARISRDSAVSV